MDMKEAKKIAVDAVEAKKDKIYGLADEIWSHPELSLKEYGSCETYVNLLKEEGFEVEKGILGIETSFKASYGSGRPVIALLAEYDALTGLSQKAGSVIREPRDNGDTESDCGHGCGHNLLGSGALAAAIGVKAFLEQTGRRALLSFLAVLERRALPPRRFLQGTACGSRWMQPLPGTLRTAMRWSREAPTPAFR